MASKTPVRQVDPLGRVDVAVTRIVAAGAARLLQAYPMIDQIEMRAGAPLRKLCLDVVQDPNRAAELSRQAARFIQALSGRRRKGGR